MVPGATGSPSVQAGCRDRSRPGNRPAARAGLRRCPPGSCPPSSCRSRCRCSRRCRQRRRSGGPSLHSAGRRIARARAPADVARRAAHRRTAHAGSRTVADITRRARVAVVAGRARRLGRPRRAAAGRVAHAGVQARRLADRTRPPSPWHSPSLPQVSPLVHAEPSSHPIARSRPATHAGAGVAVAGRGVPAHGGRRAGHAHRPGAHAARAGVGPGAAVVVVAAGPVGQVRPALALPVGRVAGAGGLAAIPAAQVRVGPTMHAPFWQLSVRAQVAVDVADGAVGLVGPGAHAGGGVAAARHLAGRLRARHGVAARRTCRLAPPPQLSVRVQALPSLQAGAVGAGSGSRTCRSAGSQAAGSWHWPPPPVQMTAVPRAAAGAAGVAAGAPVGVVAGRCRWSWAGSCSGRSPRSQVPASWHWSRRCRPAPSRCRSCPGRRRSGCRRCRRCSGRRGARPARCRRRRAPGVRAQARQSFWLLPPQAPVAADAVDTEPRLAVAVAGAGLAVAPAARSGPRSSGCPVTHWVSEVQVFSQAVPEALHTTMGVQATVGAPRHACPRRRSARPRRAMPPLQLAVARRPCPRRTAGTCPARRTRRRARRTPPAGPGTGRSGSAGPRRHRRAHARRLGQGAGHARSGAGAGAADALRADARGAFGGGCWRSRARRSACLPQQPRTQTLGVAHSVSVGAALAAAVAVAAVGGAAAGGDGAGPVAAGADGVPVGRGVAALGLADGAVGVAGAAALAVAAAVAAAAGDPLVDADAGRIGHPGGRPRIGDVRPGRSRSGPARWAGRRTRTCRRRPSRSRRRPRRTPNSHSARCLAGLTQPLLAAAAALAAVGRDAVGGAAAGAPAGARRAHERRAADGRAGLAGPQRRRTRWGARSWRPSTTPAGRSSPTRVAGAAALARCRPRWTRRSRAARSRQTPWGSTSPAGTGVHWPILPGSRQLTQGPLQATLQQTPSAQDPLSHSVRRLADRARRLLAALAVLARLAGALAVGRAAGRSSGWWWCRSRRGSRPPSRAAEQLPSLHCLAPTTRVARHSGRAHTASRRGGGGSRPGRCTGRRDRSWLAGCFRHWLGIDRRQPVGHRGALAHAARHVAGQAGPVAGAAAADAVDAEAADALLVAAAGLRPSASSWPAAWCRRRRRAARSRRPPLVAPAVHRHRGIAAAGRRPGRPSWPAVGRAAPAERPWSRNRRLTATRLARATTKAIRATTTQDRRLPRTLRSAARPQLTPGRGAPRKAFSKDAAASRNGRLRGSAR